MKKAVFFCNGQNIPDVYPPAVRQAVESLTDLYPQVISSREMNEYKEVLKQTQIIFSTWGMPALSEEEIVERLPNLEAVFYGAGSVQAFARPYLHRDIVLVSAWAANARPVIEYASSMIQLSLKGFLPVQAMTKASWRDAKALAVRYPGAYDGVSVGIIGAGMIGRGVLEQLREMDVAVLAYDPYCPQEVVESLGAAKQDDLKALFAQCQVVSNHVANLPATREMLRYEHFAAMPPCGTFINTGRNTQVHVPGLVQALHERPDLTAFLDVTDPDEPPSPENPLLTCDNVYLTPHIAGSMGLERGRQGQYMVDECRRWLAGESMRYRVSLKMLETMA